MAIDQKFREFRVNSLPSSGLQAGDRYYLSVGGGKYKTFIVSDNLVLTGDAGAEFIEKDTMSQMRALSAREIWALENGYYKGVRLHGYYAKGDTPAPIEYYLSDTSKSDNGGSVVELPVGIKLVHTFGTTVNMKYFGVVGDRVTDDTSAFQRAINYARNCILRIPRGVYKITRRIDLPDNWQVVLEGEGKASKRGADFSSGDGMVKISWEGDSSEEAVFRSTSKNFEGDLRNLYIINRGGVRDVDGIAIEGHMKVSNVDRLTVTGFNAGFRVMGDFYYTEFNKCLFYNNDRGFHAESDNPNTRALANGAMFSHCQFSHNRVGFDGRSLGEIINFSDCYVENNEQWGFSFSGCKTINIVKCYIEFNGEAVEYSSSRRGFFKLSTSNGPDRNASEMALNLDGNFFFGRGENTFCGVVPALATEMSINLKGNNFQGNQWNDAVMFRFPNSSYPQYAGVHFSGNMFSPVAFNDGDMAFSNYNFSAFKYIDIGKDSLISHVYPYLENYATKNEVVGGNIMSGVSPNRNVTATKTINFPFANTAKVGLNIFNNTNTTGTKTLNLYKGDGTNDVTIRLNAGTGSVDANEYRFSGVNRVIESGGANPEGSVSRSVGSMYLRASAGNERPYYKVGSGDSGWEPIAFLSDLPEQIVLDPVSDITTPDATDEATAIALANDNKAKINELLAELRTAGIIAT